MELRLLKYFLAVVHEENISRAAEALCITQPTLSRQIAQLEDELGAQLFERGKKLSLTEAGMMLKRRAEELVQLEEKIKDEFSARKEVSGMISFGCGGLNSFRELARAMEGFKKLHPNVSYNLYANSAEYVKERLEQGLLDFGLIVEPTDVSKFDYVRLKTRDRWGLFMNAKNPLAQKERIEKEDLRGQSLVFSGRLSMQSELAAWFGDDLSKLDIFATHNLATNTSMLVELGFTSALGVEGAVDLYDAQKFAFRPLYPELVSTSVLVWKRFQGSFTAAQKFLEYFKKSWLDLPQNSEEA